MAYLTVKNEQFQKRGEKQMKQVTVVVSVLVLFISISLAMAKTPSQKEVSTETIKTSKSVKLHS